MPSLALRGLFVTGTDTEVGKTVVASAVAATLAVRGRARLGLQARGDGPRRPADEPPDHERLRAAARSSQRQRSGAVPFGPPVSPHLAAEWAGRADRPRPCRAAARAGARRRRARRGGRRRPAGAAVGRLPRARPRADLGLPVVIAARPGLGTISHTLMTLECARAAGLGVAAVVLTPWPAAPARWSAPTGRRSPRLGRVAVETLPMLAVRAIGPQREFPVERWREPRRAQRFGPTGTRSHGLDAPA